MVYAVNNYSNNKPYKRSNNKSVLDNIIKRFSGEATSQYKVAGQKKTFVDKSVQKLVNNSIIKGCFPKENVVREMAIKRINKTLCIILSVLILVVVVSYYFVLSCEMQLNDISRQAVVLNNENEELQNKLDSLKSFSNVDKTLQKNNMLQKSGTVIETQEVTVKSDEINQHKKPNKKFFNYAIGF